MRPFKKATYYEKIKCRTSVEGEEAGEPFEFDNSKGKDLLQPTNIPVERRLTEQKENGKNEENGGKLINEENNKNKSNEKIDKENNKKSSEKMQGPTTHNNELERQNQENERKEALKKLSKKIHEFSLLLRSK
uniref:Uncharacterized protein n=1 Tax=Meloidogyne hapla TaxID=6305 RepID=A0A1I8BQI5_MELHA